MHGFEPYVLLLVGEILVDGCLWWTFWEDCFLILGKLSVIHFRAEIVPQY